MAVSKIRKVSSWTLMALVGISIVVLLLFFLGGYTMEGSMKIYNNTDILLYWTYAIFFITAIVAVAFSVSGLIRSFQTNAKKATVSVVSVLLLVAVFGISYAVGSTAKLPLNADAAVYNNDVTLKLADMWLYTIYTMFVLVIIALIWGAIRKNLLKK
ncbi:hypothetical protein [Falsiporphyromonas endometrii]|uniref:Uncharacterized protein n=1 Tax=Falsiporphyromonas endometrii TaxID=1387297 RepID=A0ABV9K6W8_9PORP|nr:hypothetical protein [Porphyromonadaceae bacterium]